MKKQPFTVLPMSHASSKYKYNNQLILFYILIIQSRSELKPEGLKNEGLNISPHPTSSLSAAY